MQRKHLISLEVEKILAAATGKRTEAMDRCLLVLMFWHGLRVSDACDIKLSNVDVEGKVLRFERRKGGLTMIHPLGIEEINAVKAWLSERSKMKANTDAFFISEQLQPLSQKTAWHAIWSYCKRAGHCK